MSEGLVQRVVRHLRLLQSDAIFKVEHHPVGTVAIQIVTM
jgi:hypothetical protein